MRTSRGHDLVRGWHTRVRDWGARWRRRVRGVRAPRLQAWQARAPERRRALAPAAARPAAAREHAPASARVLRADRSPRVRQAEPDQAGRAAHRRGALRGLRLRLRLLQRRRREERPGRRRRGACARACGSCWPVRPSAAGTTKALRAGRASSCPPMKLPRALESLHMVGVTRFERFETAD